jgi:hypothetical protein
LVVAVMDKTEDIPRFTEEQLAADRAIQRTGAKQPSMTALMQAMKKYGPDGILESAIHLDEEQYDRLAVACKQMKFNRRARKWETA